MSTTRTETVVQRLATLREQLDSGMDRREFLRIVASAGYGLGMAHLLGVDDFLAVDDGDVPVVTALVRADSDDPWSIEERTKSVPADWYAAVVKAFEVNEHLARTAVTGYLGSAVVPTSYRRGGAGITAQVSADVDGVRELLERVVNGVSLDIEAIDEIEDGGRPDQYQPRLMDDVNESEIPGGVSCATEGSMATLAPALFHPASDSAFFATAYHAFEHADDPLGEPLNLPFSDGTYSEVGRVEYSYPVEDFVAVTPEGARQPATTIDGAPSQTVRGQFTRFGLADLVANGATLEKVGSQTGHSSGDIQGIDAVTCLTDDFCRRGQIRWGEETDLTDGDSGSVSYHPDPEAPDRGVLVAGFNNARTWWPGQSYVWGVAAYRLTEEYGYHF